MRDPSDIVRVGIFGSGAGARRAWEAVARIDFAAVVWFADNDVARQGQRVLDLEIIAPDQIPLSTFDVIVVGSMSRGPIVAQLQALGIPNDRVLTPSLASTAAVHAEAAPHLIALRARRETPAHPAGTPVLEHEGYCNLCEQPTVFAATGSWLRDHYKCRDCQSIPRNRALANALNLFAPDWRRLDLHESSPGGPLSAFLRRACPGYSSSHYFEDVARGEYHNGHRSEDLSAMTFPDGSFDVFCTSDVFEHVLEPERAFAEIARVLRPGGAHVFTMPWYPRLAETVVRARPDGAGGLEHVLKPVYHENPVSADGSLVTRDWGRDFVDIIYRCSGLYTTIHVHRDRALGLDGEFLEVFVSRKA
jgi:SAM-dependent methyltransferase